MCTAITYQGKNHYFGRNLDVEHSYGESVTITPRNYPLPFRSIKRMDKHYAMIGMALVVQDCPLYFDATNEHGLSMAGLDFPGNSVYHDPKNDADNITPFELIPWILGQCVTVSDALSRLNRVNILNEDFSKEFSLTPMHWILADRNKCVVIEPMADRLKIYDNPVGVLTNNPPFPYHYWNIQNYLHFTAQEPANTFSPKLPLTPCSHGLGAFGLPGDLSSPSRFIRAAFVKANSPAKQTEEESISQFFHILGSVAQQDGCAETANGWNKTVYASCCNTDELIYYYHTYYNRQITAVPFIREWMDDTKLHIYPLVTKEQIRWEH